MTLERLLSAAVYTLLYTWKVHVGGALAERTAVVCASVNYVTALNPIVHSTSMLAESSDFTRT